LIGVDQPFDTMRLPAARDVVAPDGSDVRVLLRLAGGSMAHFELAGGRASRAVAHRSVDEIWYVLSGRGEMWRSQAGRESGEGRREGRPGGEGRRGGEGRQGGEGGEEIVALEPGTCLSIPVGTSFQFRSLGDGPLAAVAVTMPPWPGEDEAREVSGAWPAGDGTAPC
jgi:mannose-6-phosphate isomerase-like protein (cupin superfamily)